jgi:exonuclease SbcD
MGKDNIRIRFIADTHLGFDYPVHPRIERRRRGPDFFDNFHRALDSAHTSGIDLLIHGGDLFFRSRVPSKIVDLTYRALLDFASRGIPVAVVPGNHERSRLPESLYLMHPNIFVFIEPATFTFDVRGVHVYLSGFPCERKNVRSRFREIVRSTRWTDEDGDVKLLCIHQAVEGAQVGPSNYTFRNGEDVIRFDDIPDGFHAILSGHIHREQILEGTVGSGKTVKVIYPGSIERTSFAEKREEKGFYDLTFSPTDSGKWILSGIDFRNLPARPMVDLCIGDNIDDGHLESHFRARIATFAEDSIVRIKCKGNVSDMLKKQLTSSFLRRVFPKTMNIQVGAEFRQMKKEQNK